MAKRLVVGMALAATIVVAGCSGGDDPKSSGTSPSTAATLWWPGEYSAKVDLCDAISADTLRRLELSGYPSQYDQCAWRGQETDADESVTRRLTVSQDFYVPPRTRPQYSATDEAKRWFRRPNGWQRFGPGTPVGGLGDEAKVSRRYGPELKTRRVVFAVRLRNIVFQVSAEASTNLNARHGRVPPLGELEPNTLRAVHEVLAKLGSALTPAPSAAPGLGPGEVREVRKVCGTINAADRLLPGAKGRDISPSGSSLGGGCHWDQNNDNLTVDVEAMAPSPVTGESATQIATRVFRQVVSNRNDLRKLSEPGDEAMLRLFASGDLRSVDLTVRSGNLLIHVDYSLWGDLAARPITWMQKESVRLVEDLLTDYK